MRAAAFSLQLTVLGASLWLGLYLLARNPQKPRLRWTGSGLVAYAIALAMELLQGNALFSATSGLGFVLAPGWFAEATGIQPAVAFTVVGIGLLGYAAWLWLQAGKDTVSRTAALVAIGGDSLWVIASVIVLMSEVLPLTTAGKWGVALVADVVGVFAILQLIGLRRQQRE